MTSFITKPLALVILDGWGTSPEKRGSAIARAHLPYYKQICDGFPHTTLAVTGDSRASVGTPEVGHMTIGTGRSSTSEGDRLVESIRSGAFFENEVLVRAFADVAATRGALHLVGLLSDGGVNSSTESLFALLRMAKRAGLERVFIHGILDGVDVAQRTADVYVEALEIKLADIGVGQIATLCGRHFAMDAGGNWERTARAFTMLVHAEGEFATDPVASIRNSFLRGIADEFIAPIIMESEPNVPRARISNGDTVIFFNHRAEGMRQLVRSISVADASGAAKPVINTVCLTEYDRDLNLPVAFPATKVEHALADVLAAGGIPITKISQTERFPHVTYFFNGGTETQSATETHILVPTPAANNAISQPESQSFKITDKFLRSAESGSGGLFVINLPAAEIAAAAGDLDKAVEAMQYVDTCLGEIVKYILSVGGAALVTSSHAGGFTGGWGSTAAREADPIPFHLISGKNGFSLRDGGTLADIAPTILGLLEIEKPAEMTGSDLRVS